MGLSRSLGSFGGRQGDDGSAARGEPAERAALDWSEDPCGKAQSSRNAVKHDLRGQAPIAITRGPFAEDPAEVQAFVEEVVDELQPEGAQELAEALAIAGLHVRRRRLHELEAIALAGTRRAPLLPPSEPGGPSRIRDEDQERAAAQALACDLFQQLPRYEAHLSRELDRSLSRLRGLQARRADERVIEGSSGGARLAAQ